MSNEKNQLAAGLEAFVGLLNEFRRGNINNRKAEKEVLEHHLKELSKRWNQKFPGLPRGYFPYSSFRGISRRGLRDDYLKKIIIRLLKEQQHNDTNRIIVNPACVFGRHARHLASSLEHFRVIATDITPKFNRFYEYLPGIKTPANYEFIQDDIFDPKVKVMPTAVVFFGACGSVSDGAIDYAIESNSPYLFCRTCCHNIIGGNIEIIKKFTLMNWIWRSVNLMILRIFNEK